MRRNEMGIDEIDLPSSQRRSLVRALDGAPLIAEIRDELARFTRRSVVEACASSADRLAPVVIGRLVRELAGMADTGTRRMQSFDLTRLAARMQQVADPA